MSDGGKEIGKDIITTRKPSGNEDFIRAIAKIAVAQICENQGFQGFHNSALEAFADVAVRYVMELGKTSNLYANQSGRSECNVFDLIQGLENLGSIQGFSGASDVLHRYSVAKSGTVREISQYLTLVEAFPFVFSLPSFPVSKARTPPSSFLQMGSDPPDHIPPWLPAFPFMEAGGNVPAMDAHTGSKEDDQRVDVRVVEEVKVPKKDDELMNVQQQQQQRSLTAINGSEAVELNPFLAPPLAFGEKQVSVIEPPSRIWDGNHVHLMDTFAPAERTARNEVTEVEDTNTEMKLDGRPTLRFKLSNSRKSLRVRKKVVTQMNGDDETVPVLIENNNENEEKKRRAEQILKESMETPLDATEL